ncbi:MAG: AraC family transcriptional regulator [Eubacteriales bacterium]|nr:AraC family transcriptional regulator [Eubacteriales bacterium]
MKTIWNKDDRFEMLREDFELFHNYTEHSVATQYHTHNFYEILFFLSGTVEYEVEGRRYFLRPGDIILTNNSELHKTIIGEGRPYDRYVLWIRPEYLETMSCRFPDFAFSACFDSTAQFHYNLVRPGQEVFASCLQLLEKLMAMEPASMEQGMNVLRACCLTELLVLLNLAQKNTELTPGIHVISNPKIDEVVFYINTHLREDLTLDTLARQFFVSKFYLSRLFKECMGISLHQYILNKRLLLAKRLLSGGMEPYLVCGEAGFGDYSHFSRSFKRYFGIAPREV